MQSHGQVCLELKRKILDCTIKLMHKTQKSSSKPKYTLRTLSEALQQDLSRYMPTWQISFLFLNKNLFASLNFERAFFSLSVLLINLEYFRCITLKIASASTPFSCHLPYGLPSLLEQQQSIYQFLSYGAKFPTMFSFICWQRAESCISCLLTIFRR